MRTRTGGAVAAFLLLLPFRAFAANYDPIDCAKAISLAEHTVCTVYSLGQAEARLATLYGIATTLVAMGQRSNINEAQNQWLKQRDTCGADVSCLSNLYRVRISALSKVLDDVASRGPF